MASILSRGEMSYWYYVNEDNDAPLDYWDGNVDNQDYVCYNHYDSISIPDL